MWTMYCSHEGQVDVPKTKGTLMSGGTCIRMTAVLQSSALNCGVVQKNYCYVL